MKQFLFEISQPGQIELELSKVQNLCRTEAHTSVLAHVYYGNSDLSLIPELTRQIRQVLPDVQIAGTTSSGEVYHGHLMDQGILIAISVFATTRVQVRIYDCTKMSESSAGQEMSRDISTFPDTVAAEMLASLKNGFDTAAFLKGLDECAPEIQIFGAGADLHDSSSDTVVFCGDGSCRFGVLGVIYAGKDFHIRTEYALGWKSLGRSMKVTRADGNVLYELDGKPAFSIYEKYLRIKYDDHFLENILEFPLIFSTDGNTLTRDPIASDTDGRLILGANIEEGVRINLAYGDPTAIIAEVLAKQELLRQFEPEAIIIYSCVTRKSFWNYYVNKELEPFETAAPSSGFYTFGEFIRKNGTMMFHNATLIAAGMREGEPKGHPGPRLKSEEENMHGQMSMLLRLVNFVQETTGELEEANAKLSEMAERDGLTGLYNRRQIETLIREKLIRNCRQQALSSGMLLDIDHFKHVNDHYGHDIGDMVLIRVAEIIRKNSEKIAIPGRWGGEEFAILIENADEEDAVQLAEKIRKEIAETDFTPVRQVTVSIGVITIHNAKEAGNIYKKVDWALYKAKKEGRNRVWIYTEQ